MSRLIDADAMAESLEHDVELDARALDSTDLVGPEREHVQFDKDCKQNCMWYLTEQPTIPAQSWHRVEDEPKDEGKYLVSDGRGNYFVVWWGPRLGWCYDPKFFCYWMPIEPPKEDA